MKKLVTLLLMIWQDVTKSRNKHNRKEQVKNVEKIRKDPAAEWNRRYGSTNDRMPGDDTESK